MSYGYNSLNDIEIDDLKIGLCPVCNKRLTAECGHSTTIESQEWLAAHIVAEQELYNERHPADVAFEIESRIDAELGQHTVISGGEVLELSSAQPADNDNIPF